MEVFAEKGVTASQINTKTINSRHFLAMASRAWKAVKKERKHKESSGGVYHLSDSEDEDIGMALVKMEHTAKEPRLE